MSMGQFSGQLGRAGIIGIACHFELLLHDYDGGLILLRSSTSLIFDALYPLVSQVEVIPAPSELKLSLFREGGSLLQLFSLHS